MKKSVSTVNAHASHPIENNSNNYISYPGNETCYRYQGNTSC